MFQSILCPNVCIHYACTYVMSLCGIEPYTPTQAGYCTCDSWYRKCDGNVKNDALIIALSTAFVCKKFLVSYRQVHGYQVILELL